MSSHLNHLSYPTSVLSLSDSEPHRRQSQTKARKEPIKEEQPPNEPSLTSSSSSEEKVGRVR